MRGQTTQRTLLITTATSLAAFIGGYITSSEVGSLGPNDMQIVIRGSTVKVHAVDLRETTPGAAVPAYTMQVYAAAVNGNDGGAYDMGGVLCSLDDAGMAQLQTRMSGLGPRTCAVGDSGIDPAFVDVHGLDLRRAVNPDGGVDLVNVRAYGNYVGVDGGVQYLPGYDCGIGPANALTLMNQLARACFMKAKGLAQ